MSTGDKDITQTRRLLRNRVLAVLAGGSVLGIGGTLTLAAWTDTEWVYGGTGATGGLPGIGTSTFEVLQNTTSPFDADAANWASDEPSPGGGLRFGPGALALSPGETVYAPVALTTDDDSDGGELLLQQLTPPAGYDQALWDALTLAVGVLETAPGDAPLSCDAASFGSYDVILAEVTGLGTGVPAQGPDLEPDSGNLLHYCFKIGLPSGADNSLQGRVVAPVWEFDATSN